MRSGRLDTVTLQPIPSSPSAPEPNAGGAAPSVALQPIPRADGREHRPPTHVTGLPAGGLGPGSLAGAPSLLPVPQATGPGRGAPRPTTARAEAPRAHGAALLPNLAPVPGGTPRAASVEGGEPQSIGASQLVSPNPNAEAFRTDARTGPLENSEHVHPRTARLIDAPSAKHMSAEEAYAELDRLGIPYTRLRSALGVSDPVRIEFPFMGIDFPYVHKANRDGTPHTLLPRKRMTLDVRMVAALAHLVQHLQVQAEHTGWEVLAINQIGGHVTHTNDGKLRTSGQHPRGLALDIHSFVLRNAEGQEVLVSLQGDWLTARSSRENHGGRVVLQTPDEAVRMSVNEQWLRQLWGFMETEFDLVVTPSHNRAHQDHFHPQLSSTRRQAQRQRASMDAYLETHPEARP